MVCWFARFHPLRSRTGFRATGFLVLIVVVFPFVSVEAQLWFGPSMGVELPIRSSETLDGPGYGIDLAFRVFKEKHIDLLVSGYVTGVSGGNDADPWVPLAIGARWFRQFGDNGDVMVPFVSLGLSAGYTIGNARSPVAYTQVELASIRQ